MKIYNDHRDGEINREEEPSLEELEYWVFDSVCEATDGCEVEGDGICPHRHKSWLLVLGMI